MGVETSATERVRGKGLAVDKKTSAVSAVNNQLHTIVSDNNVSQETTKANSLFWLEMCAYPVHCLWSRRSVHLHQERIEPVHQS